MEKTRQQSSIENTSKGGNKMKAYVYNWGDELCISRYRDDDDAIEIDIDEECFDRYVKAWDDYQNLQAELHNKSMKARTVIEPSFDVFEEHKCYWGSPAIVIRYAEYEDLPKILEYKGQRYARLSYNSDYHTATYTVRAYTLLAKEITK